MIHGPVSTRKRDGRDATAVLWRRRGVPREVLNPSAHAVRAEKYHEYGGRCAYCSEVLDPFDFHIDHMVPQVEGVIDERWNLKATCPTCNLRKGTMDINTFRQVLGVEWFWFEVVMQTGAEDGQSG